MVSRTDYMRGSVPRIRPPLDPGFYPLILQMQALELSVRPEISAEKITIALRRNSGQISHYSLRIPPRSREPDPATFFCIERTVKFLLWSRGGFEVTLSGPRWIADRLSAIYCESGKRAFDAQMMERIYGHPLEIRHAPTVEELPPPNEEASPLGGHLDGCRIGFDLGASDYKLASMLEGKVLFHAEIPWNPKDQSDPSYHFAEISSGLKLAASKLPRVDAIGGSAAGVYVDNQVKVASLFRSVPAQAFEARVRPMFLRLAEQWRVPFTVVNDGEVTALAGGLSIGSGSLLGIALGSSQAAGYLDGKGRITGWLNELAFAPVDASQAAARDEWSGDLGVGASYFSQQAVNRLAQRAGFNLDPGMNLAERLKYVQQRADQGDPAARGVAETIGVYLGYTLPYYARFYDLRHVLVLGRVTSGTFGDVIVSTAEEVLKKEFPHLAASISLHVPGEETRRVGQAVAAATLPETGAASSRCAVPENGAAEA